MMDIFQYFECIIRRAFFGSCEWIATPSKSVMFLQQLVRCFIPNEPERTRCFKYILLWTLVFIQARVRNSKKSVENRKNPAKSGGNTARMQWLLFAESFKILKYFVLKQIVTYRGSQSSSSSGFASASRNLFAVILKLLVLYPRILLALTQVSLNIFHCLSKSS